jgi:polyisoprenoid-binding protein YceI
MANEIKWSVDQSHSEIAFKVRHLMISFTKGSFKVFDASIYTTDTDFTTAQIDCWIEAASINTGDDARDEHLRSAEFFDVAKFPQISFVASTIGQPEKDGNHVLWGELTMKGITKTLRLDVIFGGVMTDPYGNEKAGFTVTGVINRSDWGLTWNTNLNAGNFMLGEEVTITCDLELINKGGKDMVMELMESKKEAL